MSLFLGEFDGAPNSNICFINGSLGRYVELINVSFGRRAGVKMSPASPDDPRSLVMLL